MGNTIRSTACLAAMSLLVTFAGVTRASAQTGRAVALEVTAGTVSFIEVTERFAGGAARFYLSPRFAIGPGVARIHGHGHTLTTLTMEATIDFPPSPKDASVEVPYVVVGLGVLGASYRGAIATSPTTFVGGGIRCVVRRFTIGADLRVGTPLQLRLSLNAGIRLGG